MKLYVTQGHEYGIGIEVFIKSCLLMKKSELKLIKFLGYKKSVEKTLILLKLPYIIDNGCISIAGTCIDVIWLNEINHSQSFTSLEHAMRLAESGGILFTLPTSKDQFPGFPGHTEYFRSYYHKKDLAMFFSSPKLQILLLSDHLPIKNVPNALTENVIYDRMSLAINSLRKWNWPINKILISGINPHAGENGLIGDEDSRISVVVKRLKAEFKLEVAGPIPGDTMVLEKKSPHDLLVYLFHDQGLGVFKALQGFIGSNITLGLSYPRFSPDHGTSFGLFGKNIADYRGCAFSLKQALNLLKKVSHGKNSSHQSQGT